MELTVERHDAVVVRNGIPVERSSAAYVKTPNTPVRASCGPPQRRLKMHPHGPQPVRSGIVADGLPLPISFDKVQQKDPNRR